MSEYSADQVIGKVLTAAKTLTAHIGNPESLDTFKINAGNYAGTVYSYILRPGNVLWWQFYEGPKIYFIQHTPDSFSLDGIVDQGAKTTKEITEEAKNKDKGVLDLLEEFGSGAGGVITKVGLTAAVLWGVSKIISSTSK